MGLFDMNFDTELSQVKKASKEIINDQLGPMIDKSITKAGSELEKIVTQASGEIQENIKIISNELHNQRRITREEIEGLINYASEVIGKTIDQRLDTAKKEVSTLFSEKIEQIKSELEDATRKSRKTLYFNLCVSIAAAVTMGVVGIIYKKISIGELDVFSLFRVLLLSLATGTGFFAALKTFSQWKSMNKAKRHVIAIAVTQLGVLRPNGAFALFLLSLVLLTAWGFALYYK